MRITRALLSLATGFLLAAVATAHEGHEHKAMGTVTTVKEAELEIKTTEGQATILVLDSETKYQRQPKAQAAWTDLKPGDRVVVSYVEKDGKKRARLVRLSAAPAPAVSASPAPPAPSPKP